MHRNINILLRKCTYVSICHQRSERVAQREVAACKTHDVTMVMAALINKQQHSSLDQPGAELNDRHRSIASTMLTTSTSGDSVNPL